MESNRKVLPRTEPLLSTCPDEANLLSILLNYEESHTWVYTNFIQLQFITRNYNGTSFPIKHYSPVLKKVCPYVIIQSIDKKVIDTYFTENKFSDFVIKAINDDQYVQTCLNHTHISSSDFNQSHAVFIYGYDKNTETFLVADNGFGEGQFATSTCTFEELNKAYYEMNARYDVNIQMGGKVELFLYNKKAPRFLLNLSAIRDQINDYLFSLNSDSRINTFSCNEIYGICIYDKLLQHVEQVKAQNTWSHYRPFHMLMEHKSLMVHRLTYLRDHHGVSNLDAIIDGYKELHKICKINVAYNLKYEFTKTSLNLDRIIKNLTSIMENEKKLLELLLDVLSNQHTEEPVS
ncbi:hypothetical protein GC096_08515 [Paenibacillus sp. LMG 31461]|uniref:Butirosin biosynthesis protein H N-terminal domain-containing protein n=1 Tax=Paenibacillus plantarum TaxID=2654975 RepID=A0ABX1X6K6_9BACL|nr:hypothetical protein [Paenibacillus plantarum]NOU64065.1 hypothetical protein [Paenibacillus plantarum]